MKKILLLFIPILIFGCASRNIAYNRYKIIKRYAEKYQILLDNKAVDFKNVYLDKGNIKNVLVDRRTKKVMITQLERRKLVSLNNFIDSLYIDSKTKTKEDFSLIVLNGVPFRDSLLSKTRIDIHSIKKIKIFKPDKSGVLCWSDSNVLVIVTNE